MKNNVLGLDTFQPLSLSSAIRFIASTGLVAGLAVNTTAMQLEEVVVTAQHRAENVQDVPIAVSAIGGEELAKADIFDAGSIAARVPGLSYAEFSPGQGLPSMRGISSADDGAGLDNSVSLFLDGVYIGRAAAINFDMFDLERLEVLRGPQGTLFGRNAIGGAISVVTSKPTDEFTAKLGATVGNEGILRYQGLVSGGLTDNLAGKISVTHREHDGYVKNLLLNKDQQDEDQTSFRGQLRWELDGSEWLLSADYMEDDREDMGRTPVVDRAPLTAIMAANGGGGPRETTAPGDGFSKREASGISLQGDIDFDSGVFTTITSFRNAETDWEMASIGAPLGVIGIPFDEVIDDIVEDIDTFSQEFRWTSTLDGNFNYTVGLYFLQEETKRKEQFKTTAPSIAAGPTPFVVTTLSDGSIIGNEISITENETTSYAIYGQGTWELNEYWSITLGARYTVDEKDYRATSVNCGLDLTGTEFENFPGCEGVGGSLAIINEAFTVTPSDEWGDFSPKLAVEYHPNDSTMIFASASKGFKSGGFAGSQGVKAAASQSVDPEIAWNYELGFKSDLLDNSLRLNMTAFYTDYEDLQIVRFGRVNPTDPFGTFLTTNIGEAVIQGVELEFTWNLSENFQISGNHAYLDTEADDFVINGQDLSGTDLRQAPENSSSLLLNYNLDTDVGGFDFRLEYTHTDRQITDYLDQRTSIDEVELFSARIGWVSVDEKWDVSVWGKNLKDDDYISHTYTVGPGIIGTWGAPRTVGLTVNYNI
ncbi:TonB-dependent receptor [Pseudomaricurvus alkylphenolicus]|jgi:iron complex outermembrane receptor protein|uniref:TonB-dependent receptor n=1 Tax=Pseudomaricurvus alkylphenolicus TaxID=1306991 RepID=UPI001423E857|nr:TonB-dependent receptor [Pseudomaricurvus alkylphenolicus]NIB43889.1 TonB-dependent receptor [Pseudomaricurvus alkylphenolicus]